MKFSLFTAVLAAVLFMTCCETGSNTPGCQTSSSYCRNYTGSSWLAYPRTFNDFYDDCSGDFYKAGCPENTAYAVFRKEDYYEDFNYEYVFYTTSLTAGMVTFDESECTILNNN